MSTWLSCEILSVSVTAQSLHLRVRGTKVLRRPPLKPYRLRNPCRSITWTVGQRPASATPYPQPPEATFEPDWPRETITHSGGGSLAGLLDNLGDGRDHFKQIEK